MKYRLAASFLSQTPATAATEIVSAVSAERMSFVIEQLVAMSMIDETANA